MMRPYPCQRLVRFDSISTASQLTRCGLASSRVGLPQWRTRATFTATRQLAAAAAVYLDASNAALAPFRWIRTSKEFFNSDKDSAC